MQSYPSAQCQCQWRLGFESTARSSDLLGLSGPHSTCAHRRIVGEGTKKTNHIVGSATVRCSHIPQLSVSARGDLDPRALQEAMSTQNNHLNFCAFRSFGLFFSCTPSSFSLSSFCVCISFFHLTFFTPHPFLLSLSLFSSHKPPLSLFSRPPPPLLLRPRLMGRGGRNATA